MALFIGAKLFYVAKNRCVISPSDKYPAPKDMLAGRLTGHANENGMLCLLKKSERILRPPKIEGTKGVLTQLLLDLVAAFYCQLTNANM